MESASGFTRSPAVAGASRKGRRGRREANMGGEGRGGSCAASWCLLMLWWERRGEEKGGWGVDCISEETGREKQAR